MSRLATTFEDMPRSIGRLWRRTALVLCLMLFTNACLAAGQGLPGPVFPRADAEHCVAPTPTMRRRHMDFIMHQRDETVIEGIRGMPFSLTECVNCHAGYDDTGTALRIDAPGQFCQSCHDYTAVKIDCFSCHRALPDGDSNETSSDSLTGHARD